MNYRRRGKLYTIERGGTEPHPGSDKTIFTFHVQASDGSFDNDLFVHFPHTILFRNNLNDGVLHEISMKKIQDWFDRGMGESPNLYVVREDVPENR